MGCLVFVKPNLKKWYCFLQKESKYYEVIVINKENNYINKCCNI